MSVPVSQVWAVAKHVLWHACRGIERYPLVLMLEPLMRCNLACRGCGKIQHPPEILRRNLSVEQCATAAAECDAPVVSIPGGEPLLHPEIDQVVEALVEQGRYIYLCTNAIKLREALSKFTPSPHLAFSVHLDGLREEHDHAVDRAGVYDQAVAGIAAALDAGFRVTTNTTLFNTAQPEQVRRFLDELTELGVEGMMLSPGYAYERAPDQQSFLHRQETETLFQRILREAPRSWRFNQTPLFLEFLQGAYDLDCTPWGSPTYNVFGWQRPCYLLDEGYCESFQELMETTAWENYGHQSGNPKCAQCMVHCGFEPSAVRATFTTVSGLVRSAWTTLFGPTQPAPNPMPEAPSDRRPGKLALPVLQ